MKTVAELRQEGFKVFVKHSRYYLETRRFLFEKTLIYGPLSKSEKEASGFGSENLFAKGGKTEVEIYKNGVLLGEGHAVCSLSDNFNRKIGLQIALGRAQEDLNMVNWTQILNEVGQERLRSFCEGKLTRREFERCGGTARTLIRELGAKETRTRARKALSRRTS